MAICNCFTKLNNKFAEKFMKAGNPELEDKNYKT
jgi:hypothetical protein